MFQSKPSHPLPSQRRLQSLGAVVLLSALLLASAGCVRSLFGDLPECRPGLAPGSICRVSLDRLHPTQPAVGMREVALREAEIKAKKPKGLVKYLTKNPVEIVIGPGGQPWVVDRHHLALAVLRSGRTTDLPARVRADFSSLPPADFLARLKAENLVYLKDSQGNPIPETALPTELSGLGDDPYRDLAYAVRKRGGYEKAEVPFSEFRWADFFRSRVRIGPGPEDFDRAVDQAVQLARTPEAAGLPGYAGPAGGASTGYNVENVTDPGE